MGFIEVKWRLIAIKKPSFGGLLSLLPVQVSNTASGANATNGTQLSTYDVCPEIILTSEEKSRLVRYFDVLIEIDSELRQQNSGPLT